MRQYRQFLTVSFAKRDNLSMISPLITAKEDRNIYFQNKMGLYQPFKGFLNWQCLYVVYHRPGASIIFPQENKSVSLAMNKGKYLDQICCNIWRYNRVLLLFWSHSHEENCIYRAYLYRSDSSITYIVYNCCNNVYASGVALWRKEWVVCCVVCWKRLLHCLPPSPPHHTIQEP